MKYLPQHAAQALEIVRRYLDRVPQRREYLDLIATLEAPSRWREAHERFSAIRSRVTLPLERQKKEDAEAYFVHIAENAAKTAYNCSDPDDPFDEDSFEWLLRCEQEFVAALKKQANQSPEPTRSARGCYGKDEVKR